MIGWLKNVGYLSLKELRSLFSDLTLIVLIVYMFSVALYIISNMPTTELKNAAVAVVDNDRSTLSYRLRDSLIAPSFNKVDEVSAEAVDDLMDYGKYTFILDIPPNYERDILKGLNPKIQLLVDATAMTQANVGSVYISQIFGSEIADYLKIHNVDSSPLDASVNVLYNPNHYTKWLMGTMQPIGNLTLLMLLLVGAAVIREKERGTLEHLLVMPVTSSEIAVAKIVTNGLVLLTVCLISLTFMVKGVLDVPLSFRQFPLFALGCAAFIFSISSLGILLAIIAPSMPQFSLLCIPTYLVMYMLSGTNSPLENMPELAQQITQFSPATIFGAYTQDVLIREGELRFVWGHLAKLIGLGALFLTVALVQFKSMLSRQG